VSSPAATRTPGAPDGGDRPRREAEITFLRLVPGDSAVHRLWAGTKLLAATEVAIAASIAPSWLTLLVLACVVGMALLVAQIPLGAFPRLPRGLYLFVLLGLALDAISSAKPVVHLGALPISFGALGDAVLFLGLGVVLIVSAAVVGWTTPLGSVAPALARLTRPLRALRIPVDEWIVALALALRCLPLLVDEMRTLAAARRLRRHEPTGGRRRGRVVVEIHDLVSTAIVVSLRRAHDLADAITARGGIAAISSATDDRFGWADAITLLLVSAVCAALALAGRR